MSHLGYGKGYQYAHDAEEKVTDMTCLPESLRGANITSRPTRASRRASGSDWRKFGESRKKRRRATKSESRKPDAAAVCADTFCGALHFACALLLAPRCVLWRRKSRSWKSTAIARCSPSRPTTEIVCAVPHLKRIKKIDHPARRCLRRHAGKRQAASSRAKNSCPCRRRKATWWIRSRGLPTAAASR